MAGSSWQPPADFADWNAGRLAHQLVWRSSGLAACGCRRFRHASRKLSAWLGVVARREGIDAHELILRTRFERSVWPWYKVHGLDKVEADFLLDLVQSRREAYQNQLEALESQVPEPLEDWSVDFETRRILRTCVQQATLDKNGLLHMLFQDAVTNMVWRDLLHQRCVQRICHWSLWPEAAESVFFDE